MATEDEMREVCDNEVSTVSLSTAIREVLDSRGYDRDGVSVHSS